MVDFGLSIGHDKARRGRVERWCEMEGTLVKVFGEILEELDSINEGNPPPVKTGRRYECGTCQGVYERINKVLSGELDEKEVAGQLIWAYREVLKNFKKYPDRVIKKDGRPTLATRAEYFIDLLDKAVRV